MATTASPLNAEQLGQLQALLDAQRAGTEQSTQQVQQPTATAVAAEPQPLKFSFGGVSYEARDEAELQRIMAQVDQARNAEYEAARIREQAQSQQQRPATASADSFDKEEYARLFLDDPRKANRYAMQHDPEQLRFYGNLVSQVENLRQESAAQQFLLANPDYERTPANYKTLEGIMRQYNLPPDANGFGLAFIAAKQSGLIAADSSTAATATGLQQQLAEPNVVSIAPPRLRKTGRGSVSDDTDVLRQFESLSPDKMKEFLLAQA